MATARNVGLVSAPFYADVALDDYQYYACYAASTAGYVALATGTSDPYPLGVLQDNNASANGQAVQVGMFGPMVAKAAACDAAGNACPITPGDWLAVSSSGTFIRSGSDALAVARAISGISTACSVGNIEIFFLGMAACVDEAS